MRHYYVLNSNPHLEMIFEFIQHHDLKLEVHLNRTRFWVPDGTTLTEFLLRFSEQCAQVDDTVDLTTGRAIT